MTHTFFLAHPEKDSSTILIGLRDGTKRKTVSTGITIQVKNWDKINKTIIKKSTDGIFLARLSLLESDVTKAVRIANAEMASLADLYNSVLKIIGREETREDDTRLLLPFYRYWATHDIGEHKATKHTLLAYNIINEYIIDKKVLFDKVDYAFYIDFLEWMKTVKKFSINTQGRQIQCLNAVMNEALKRELHTNFTFKKFAKPKEKVDSIFLTLEEYEKLYQLQLKGLKEKARDLFLIGCYTGMRVSDYSRLTLDDIRDGFIYFEQKKTKRKIVIPAHRRVIEIIEKYNGAPKICEQNLNVTIKEVCKLAGINEKIRIKKNGIYEYKEKYKLVSSHTARRSAATNMALNGTPLRDIMQITGHSTESSLLRYIKISDEQNARRLASNPFFL